jgi:SAM-dependent methyltransferase
MTDELLAEQNRYYRARAPEYDATSRPAGDPYAALEAEAEAAIRTLGPVDLAIELGPGTGQYTGQLAAIASRVIAVDSAPEMLAINAEKVRATNVERVVANVFEWRPPAKADVVLFGALLSHIPSDRFEAFWRAVDDMLRPGGKVFVLDESHHDLWREEVACPAAEVVIRTLQDGRRFRIVKVLWDPHDLEARLAESGWRASLVRRDPFYWGTVERATE